MLLEFPFSSLFVSMIKGGDFALWAEFYSGEISLGFKFDSSPKPNYVTLASSSCKCVILRELLSSALLLGI